MALVGVWSGCGYVIIIIDHWVMHENGMMIIICVGLQILRICGIIIVD